MPSVAVVIPARCTGAEIDALILHLDAQIHRAFELIIVDDASDPPLARASLRLDHPSGSYAARNAGLAIARADVIAFTDADCRPDPAWLQAGLRALEGHPRVAGRIELAGAEGYFARLDRARFLRQERYVAEGFGATANLFVRRAVFDAVGPFDARLISGGDAELGRRASRAGFPIVFAPDAIVRHPCRTNGRALLEKAHRVGIGFGQTVRLHGSSGDTKARARDRLALSAREDPLIAAGLVALHGATLLGALRGYIRAQDDFRRHPSAG